MGQGGTMASDLWALSDIERHYQGHLQQAACVCARLAMLLKSSLGTNDLWQKSNIAIWQCYSVIPRLAGQFLTSYLRLSLR